MEAALDFSFISGMFGSITWRKRTIFVIHKRIKASTLDKETIERVFADAKEKHGMRWTTLRGLKKLSMQAMLTFAAMNLKKMANWTWVSPSLARDKIMLPLYSS